QAGAAGNEGRPRAGGLAEVLVRGSNRRDASAIARPVLQPPARDRQAAQPRPEGAELMPRTALSRERRLEAISLAAAAGLEEIADDVLQSLDVEIARGPHVGLLMVRAEEPSERLSFNFTEV